MEIIAGTDPFALFQIWFDEAVKTEINDPDAIALASVDASGMPSVRMVLLRRWSPDGFLFFTNYESRKSDDCWPREKRLFACIGKASVVRCGLSAISLRQQPRNPMNIFTAADAEARSVLGHQHNHARLSTAPRSKPRSKPLKHSFPPLLSARRIGVGSV